MKKGKTTSYAKVVVDCIENDYHDIKMGGPSYLGFDFFIKGEQTEEIITFIKQTLKKNKAPLIDIYSENVEEQPEHLWNKGEIEQTIEEEVSWYIEAGYIDEPDTKRVDNVEKKLEKALNKN